MKKKINREKLNERNLLRAHEDEGNSLRCHFQKYNENKYYYERNGYPAYKKLKLLNTKTRKLSDNLKDMYGITVGTDHLQSSESPNPVIKFTNCNIIQIQIFTSVYQMKLYTVISALNISRRPFAFIKVSISSDPIDYLLCNQFQVHLSDKDTGKAKGP